MRKVKNHKGKLLERNSMVNPSKAQQAVAPFVWSMRVSPQKIARTIGPWLTRKQLLEYVSEHMNTNGDY